MRGARDWRRGAALLAVCAVLATGCDSDSQATAPTATTESSTTTEPTDPVTSDGPTEPTLPAAAQGSTVKAAKAFVGYYIEVLDRALTTGDTNQLGQASAETCSGCMDYINFISDLYTKGGWRKGGDWVVDTIRLSGRPQGGLLFSLTVESKTYDLKKTSTAHVKHYKADRFSISLGVERKGRAWRVSDLFPA